MKRFAPGALPEALLLGLLGAILLWKALSGGFVLYIHPRYELALLATGAVLVAMAGGLLLLPALRVRRSLLILPALVAILALLVPARPLGASLVPGKALGGSNNDALIKRWQSRRSDDTRSWTLLEWTAATRQEDLPTLRDKPAAFEGFVFRDATLAADEVFVGRYVVTCCTADGTAISLRVKAPEAASLQPDEWVRVEGVLATVMVDGVATPQIVGSLTRIDTPRVPYLYP